MSALNNLGPSYSGNNAKYYNLLDFKNTYLFCNTTEEYEKNIEEYKKRIRKLFEERAPLKKINFEVQLLLLNKKLKERKINPYKSQDTNFNFKTWKC